MTLALNKDMDPLHSDTSLSGGVPARLLSLKLTHFRSYDRAALRIGNEAGLVVLTGDNGAGKTNILEAISFLSPGRGLRRASLEDVRNRGVTDGGKWSVSAEIDIETTILTLGTGEDPAGGARRVVRMDGETLSQSEALADHFAVSWLTPQMDRLFLEGPSARRRFLDRMVLALHPQHGRQVSAYERAVRERNKLVTEPGFDPGWCAALEARMAEHAAAIADARVDYLAQLAGQMPTESGPFPAARLSLEGDGEALVMDGMKAVDVEAELRRQWVTTRQSDAVVGRTRIGPHRTDMLTEHAEKNMPADQCSTGEQKALLVGLILAHARLIGAVTGKLPVLLLDEVAAHLDEHRRIGLFDQLIGLGAQVWLTGTDPAIFETLNGSAQFFTVEGGAVHVAT